MSFRKVRRTHCPTGAAEAKDKGQSAARLAAVAVGLAAMAVFAGCDWLLGLDTIPPTCQVTSPADSASVNGAVQIAVTATDSVGVERVEFFADGSLVGTDSSMPYSASWNASALAEGSWHSLNCIAYDVAQNKGYSDTIAVVIAATGQRSVYHGELEVAAGVARSVSFDAVGGDTLEGDVQVVSGGALTKFVWLDSANYLKFANAQPYTALFEKDNFTQTSLRQAVQAAGKYYLAFANGGGATVKCWARFVLE
jgi:hypothetical protein